MPNLPPLGSLPITSTYPSPIPQELNALTVAFNQILQGEATQLEQSLGIQIQVLDVYGLTESVFNDPSLYGFTNVTTDAVQDNGGTNAKGISSGTSCTRRPTPIRSSRQPPCRSRRLSCCWEWRWVVWLSGPESDDVLGIPPDVVDLQLNRRRPVIFETVGKTVRLRAAQSAECGSGPSNGRAGTPTTVWPSATSWLRVTTALAPTTASAPMLTGATRIAPAPIRLRSPILRLTLLLRRRNWP